jgi:hypothetical protein
MEEYANEKTVIKDSTYEALKDLVKCSICQCLMINPVICLNCQNHFCQACIEKKKMKGGNCPNNCEDAVLKNAIRKNNLIYKLKFKCINGCNAKISFEDINNHYTSSCAKKKNKDKKKVLKKALTASLIRKEPEQKTIKSKF